MPHYWFFSSQYEYLAFQGIHSGGNKVTNWFSPWLGCNSRTHVKEAHNIVEFFPCTRRLDQSTCLHILYAHLIVHIQIILIDFVVLIWIKFK